MKRSLSLADYPTFLAEVKDRVRHAHISAARTVNRELILPQPVAEIATNASLKQPVPETLSQAVIELVAACPWGHHRLMLDKAPDPAARLCYLRATTQRGWSRGVLLNQIKAGAYERAVKEKNSHNFSLALPEHFAGEKIVVTLSRQLGRRSSAYGDGACKTPSGAAGEFPIFKRKHPGRFAMMTCCARPKR